MGCCYGKPDTWEPPHTQAKPRPEAEPPAPPPESYQPDLAFRLATWREADSGEKDRALYDTSRKWYEMAPRVPGATPWKPRKDPLAGLPR